MQNRKKYSLAGFLLFSTFYLLFTVAPTAQAATLYFYPQTIEVVEGEDVALELRINTDGEIINALSVEGSLNNRKAIGKAIENSGSIIPIFVGSPTFETQSAFSLTGGIPQGFSGDGVIARLMLKAEEAGSSILSLRQSSQVYLHKGTGEAAELKTMDATIQILPLTKDFIVLSSLSHPDPNQWYKTQPAIMKWDLESGIAYSYLVSSDPTASPDNTADQPEGDLQWQGQIQLDGLGEGIFYFGVKKVGSSVVSRWRIMNDATSPVWSTVEISEGTLETDGRPFINFLANDSRSGVEYYEAQFDDEPAVGITSPYPLPDDFKVLTLKAFDRAGNSVEKVIPGKALPLWPWLLVLALIVVVGIFGILRRKSK